jgi:hypothetical protein
VADVSRGRAAVLDCRGPRAALDRLGRRDGMWVVRLGPRHAVVVSDAFGGPFDDVVAEICAADATAVLTDVSPGWSAVMLEGDGGMRRWRLSSERPVGADGEPWIGIVAGVRAIVLPEPHRVTVVYESAYDHRVADEYGLWHTVARQKVRA